MRKLRKKTAALLKDRKGNMMPLVVAVTICMLIIILGVAEYMRLVITAAGIKDAMESAVISTVNDNYNEVYHSVREGYAAGYEPDGESFSPSVDYGDIYSRMCFLLGLEEDGAGYVRINNGGEMEYCLSNLCVYIHNNALGAGGGPYYADASIRLEVPVRFAGKIITMDCQHFFRQIFLGYFSDIVQAFDTLRKNVCGDDYTSLHNPIVLSSVLPAYGMFHSIQILFL